MAQNTNIEWADATLNALAGCRKVGPECEGCYAIKDAWRMAHNPNPKMQRKFLPVVSNERGFTNWTGEATFTESALLAPLKTKKPTRYFVNSLSDLFYEKVEDAWIDKHFAVFALCPQHTFMVLTKRPVRMQAFLTPNEFQDVNFDLANVRAMREVFPLLSRIKNGLAHWHRLVDANRFVQMDEDFYFMEKWPLPNVQLGVSVGNQKYADERRDYLKQISAQGWTTFVSYEPALGPVDWTGWEFVNQIISGGESGPKARPSHPDWHRETRDFCQANGIAYFFKQWGEYANVTKPIAIANGEASFNLKGSTLVCPDGRMSGDLEFVKRDGGTWQAMFRVGKKKAGRLLDGHEWNEFPTAEAFSAAK